MSVKRIGVIGGGQLAAMMAEEAKDLNLELVIQTPSQNDPAVAISRGEVIYSPVDDATATAQLAKHCDVITFENEFIDIDALMPLSQQGVQFRPRLEALAPLLDKYQQRCYLRDIGLPVPKFTIPESEKIVSPFRFPMVVKARRHGYDGQGTFIIKDENTLQEVCQRLEREDILFEQFIPFEQELAVIAVRSLAGEVIVYPVVETQQEKQVCRRVIIPADVSIEVAKEVNAIAHTLLNTLEVVGVFGIEFFLTSEGKVLVNEIAPRTHNSGHYTLDACDTSQFKMQLQAVANLPLGSPALQSTAAVMVNLLGYEHSHSDYAQKREQLAAIPNAYLHWYGKAESRPGRKLGHITVLLDSQQVTEAEKIAQQIESLWYATNNQ